MSDKDKMKSEIEAKKLANKLRLEELKRKRAERAAAASGGPASSASKLASPSRTAAPAPPKDILADVNNLIGGSGPVKLTVSQPVAQHNIMPQEKHVYDKSFQVDLSPALSGNAAEMEKQLRKEQEALMAKEEKMKVLMEQLKDDKAKYDAMREEERLKDHLEMSAAEQNKILESPDFQEFFAKSSRIVERALDASYDVTIDYATEGFEDDNNLNSSLKVAKVFSDKKVSDRPVTSIAWSHKYPELMLSSHAGQNDSMSYDPDGTLLMWNLHMSSPEYYFECNSAVLSAQFHPTNPSLLVGACQSGQIVIWDIREGTLPINRTSLSSGHTYPCYSLTHVPVVNALHNIMSVSTDGHVCVWSDNNLHDPAHELTLTYGKEEITTTSFAYSKNDTDTILLGSDEGYVYKANIYDKQKPGIYEDLKAHDAPITRVAFHPSPKNTNTADLYLTSSYDWTVKLWSQKTTEPLYTFESARDYALDVQWSPTHPSMFAMGDGAGWLDLWNINKYTDMPAASVQVESSSSTGGKAAVNRVAWSEAGDHVAAGTSNGNVHVYSLATEVAEPSADDANVFYEKIHSKIIQ